MTATAQRDGTLEQGRSSMPNRWSLVALGLGFYMAFAVRSLPAAVALPWLLPPELQAVGLDGTVWRGGAALVSVDDLALRNVVWNVHGWPLLTLRLVADVRASLSEGTVETRLTASADAVELGGLGLSTSLTALAPLLPPATAGTRGVVRAQMETVRIEDGWPTAVVGAARLTQLAAPPIMAARGQPELVALGDYEVRFVGPSDDGTIRAEFRDVGGPLEVNGSLSLDRRREYVLAATVMARPDAPRMLVDGLAFLPEADSAGKRSVTFRGSL